MKSDIKFLKDCDFLLGQEPISNLENSIYHAEQALILANKTYDLIEGYARGRYTQNFCYDSLYGYNSDGIRYIMGDHAFEIDKEYYLYTSLFLDNLFAL